MISLKQTQAILNIPICSMIRNISLTKQKKSKICGSLHHTQIKLGSSSAHKLTWILSRPSGKVDLSLGTNTTLLYKHSLAVKMLKWINSFCKLLFIYSTQTHYVLYDHLITSWGIDINMKVVDVPRGRACLIRSLSVKPAKNGMLHIEAGGGLTLFSFVSRLPPCSQSEQSMLTG